jgi:hypothetical protein
MGLLSALPIIGPILEKTVDIVDQAVVDKDLAARLKAELRSELMALDAGVLEKELDAKAKIIVAETQGHSWLQRNWRPILMITIVAVIANNYLLYPYLSLFWTDAPAIDLPAKLFNLLAIGVGGYVVGRSGEKMVKNWKEK